MKPVSENNGLRRADCNDQIFYTTFVGLGLFFAVVFVIYATVF